MNTHYQTSPARSQAPALHGAAMYPGQSKQQPKPARKSPSNWKPEPCPLTREELRRIIIRQIG